MVCAARSMLVRHHGCHIYSNTTNQRKNSWTHDLPPFTKRWLNRISTFFSDFYISIYHDHIDISYLFNFYLTVISIMERNFFCARSLFTSCNASAFKPLSILPAPSSSSVAPLETKDLIKQLERREDDTSDLDLSLSLKPPGTITKKCYLCGTTKTPAWRNSCCGNKVLLVFSSPKAYVHVAWVISHFKYICQEYEVLYKFLIKMNECTPC